MWVDTLRTGSPGADEGMRCAQSTRHDAHSGFSFAIEMTTLAADSAVASKTCIACNRACSVYARP